MINKKFTASWWWMPRGTGRQRKTKNRIPCWPGDSCWSRAVLRSWSEARSGWSPGSMSSGMQKSERGIVVVGDFKGKGIAGIQLGEGNWERFLIEDLRKVLFLEEEEEVLVLCRFRGRWRLSGIQLHRRSRICIFLIVGMSKCGRFICSSKRLAHCN